MENYHFKGIKDVYYKPDINLYSATGECIIKGDSYLEDPVEFYKPVIEWLERYIVEVNGPINLNFKVAYFNTSSFRSFVDILLRLKEYQNNGGDVHVFWFIEDDEDLEEEIEDFVLRTGLEITKIQIDEDEDDE